MKKTIIFLFCLLICISVSAQSIKIASFNLHQFGNSQLENQNVMDVLVKIIGQFDFTAIPGLNKQKILGLASGHFIEKSENIIFVGPTGTGKTFLAKALAYEACSKNYKVMFTRTAKMLENIYAGKADGSYSKRMQIYIKPQLLILDDWGLMEFTNQSLNILNEIISERYENGSIIITSNRPIENWDELFNEPVISSALLDRIFHNSHLIKMEGKSYRGRLNL